MKRLISIILSVSIVLSMTSTAFATNNNANLPSIYVDKIQNGNIYVSQLNEKTIAILTDDITHLIDISIKYSSQPNTVYQWTISNYPVSTFTPNDNNFWNGVIAYAESNIATANVVNFESVTYNEPIEIPQTRASASADLQAELKTLLGSTYTKTLRNTTTYQGQTFRVYESMKFTILARGNKSWSTAITVSTLITGLLGLPGVLSGTVAAICGAYGVAVSAASLLNPGKINKYICRAANQRYVTANGSAYMYNTTEKFTEYNGYEDASLSSTNRAYVDKDSKDIYYSMDSTYFNSYTSQVQDAYAMFQNVGQKP